VSFHILLVIITVSVHGASRHNIKPMDLPILFFALIIYVATLRWRSYNGRRIYRNSLTYATTIL